MGMLNALNLGDVMNDLAYQIRPYEVHRGETNRVFQESMDTLCTVLRERKIGDLMETSPKWVSNFLRTKPGLKKWSCALSKVREHLYGKQYVGAMDACRESLDKIEIDRTKIKAHREDHRRVLGLDYRG